MQPYMAVFVPEVMPGQLLLKLFKLLFLYSGTIISDIQGQGIPKHFSPDMYDQFRLCPVGIFDTVFNKRLQEQSGDVHFQTFRGDVYPAYKAFTEPDLLDVQIGFYIMHILRKRHFIL